VEDNVVDMRIRAATEADLTAIVDIYNQSIPAGWSTADTRPIAVADRIEWFRKFDPTRRPIWVAEVDGRVVATAYLSSFYAGRPAYAATAEVSVYIATAYHRRGIGRRLKQWVIEQCPRLGVTTLLSMHFDHNEATRRINESLGFEQLGHLTEIALVHGHKRGLVISALRIPAGEPGEVSVLEVLDRLLQQGPVRAFLDAVVVRVEQRLRDDPAAVMAWEAIPLELYGSPLPGSIQSSWVFILRENVATGAERHPNSRQRMMSYRGSGDLQARTGERWESNLLASDCHLTLEQRWVAIPENVWHQAVTPGADWVVVSFHTVPAGELIEERPDPSDAGSTRQRRYLEMT
jgi:phosphinothricin acetyltransferase